MCACFGGTRVLCACESILVARRLKRRSDVAPVFKCFYLQDLRPLWRTFAPTLSSRTRTGVNGNLGIILGPFHRHFSAPSHAHTPCCVIYLACMLVGHLIFCLRSDVVLIQASGTSSPPTRWGPHSGSTHSSDPPTRATHRTAHRVPQCTAHRTTVPLRHDALK